MFYLCSIGSNLDPHTHVGAVLGELIEHFGPIRISSVIRTKPVGMHSRHDFLNCLLVLESQLDPASLKQTFIALELAHGRDRSLPLSKVSDRPLDIDILASSQHGDFASARVDSYLAELLAELYGGDDVQAPKVALRLALPRGTGEAGLTPLTLGARSERGQGAPAIHPDAGTGHVTVPHQ